ncbi:PHP domain protein [Dethiosulfovibrio peptidovorans DSM 11002]|uniref:PHP domain protein n=1 Tax=Dethiosulfovibrio peptidovorans DSM 11002 TaxID=469381 RepID=D2Z4G8_9BACT|nr:PHP domain-containing protein [Dethiosulfovibrio peptidovorans]EFC90497.1 PHP domain protein [Dethiosulfovibrio peptidovorans DSM 11002]
MILVDLHTHSSCSDGTVPPDKLAKLAHRSGISVVSLTDHDTVDGVPVFTRECRRLGVKSLSGVELSADYPTTMHILGYGFDLAFPELVEVLQDLRDHRERRNLEIIGRLRDVGVELTLDDVLSETHGNVVTRPHVAKAMIKKGYASSISECFQRYLKRGMPGYVSRKRLSPDMCISLIKRAGGVACLAHPIQTSQDPVELRSILKELKAMGLWGLECISRHHNSEQIFNYMRLASELELYCTAGSDFHGSNRVGVSMGVPVAEDFLPWARLGISL